MKNYEVETIVSLDNEQFSSDKYIEKQKEIIRSNEKCILDAIDDLVGVNK